MRYLILLMSSLSLMAFSGKELFFQANELQRQEQYAQASTIYESIQQPGWGVFYNNGLSYQQQSNYVMALYNFYKANTLNPFDISILTALQHNQKNLGISQHSSYSLLSLLFHPFVCNSIMLLLCIVILVSNLCMIAINKVFYMLMIGILFLCYSHTTYFSKRQNRCIVLDDKKIYCLNNQHSEVISIAAKGTCLTITKIVPHWYKVQDIHTKGWIEQDDTLII